MNRPHEARYAVYFAPAAHSPWWDFGSAWLGRDELADVPLAQPTVAGFGVSEFEALTATPRRYGFHATLKAPFRLSDGMREDDLLQQLTALASGLRPLPLGPMKVVTLSQFVAIVPTTPSADLYDLAAQTVLGLESLRAPLTDAELLRRQPEQLDPRARALLCKYGYPHVLERYRLHFTLSDAVAPDVAARLVQAATPSVHALNVEAPLLLDRLSVFVEPAAGRNFLRLCDMVLPS